jgi:outer membrane protein assembly factor BamD
MNFRVLPPLFLLIVPLVFVQPSMGSIIFRPGEKAKYVAPGDEEISGNAEELFHIAQTAEKDGNIKRAIRAYKNLVRRHPKDALAAGSLFRVGELEEKNGEYLAAADVYHALMEKYPNSPHFNEAIEAQFRIGELYLNGKKLKVLGIPFGSALDHAVEIFAAVVRSAPYGKYTARAQFDIGLAREKQGVMDAALEAYQAVVDKFPNEPIAVDAQYQIGYIWFAAARKGTKDVAATTKARTAFQDFLFRYSNSEKAAQARANLQLLDRKETSSSFNVAKFYDKQKNYRAAVIYYNEVIRQQPGSTESEHAKKRINELYAKFGPSAFQPAIAPAAAAKKKPGAPQEQTGKSESEGANSSANAAAPLPPPDADLSLPPPASLAPDTTTAPASSSSSSAGVAGSGASPASETSPTPEPAVSPAP